MRLGSAPNPSPSRSSAQTRDGQGSGTAALPRDIAFLASHVDKAALNAAVRFAKAENVAASRVLIAKDVISDTLYYRALADHLGCRFVDSWVLFATGLHKLAALRRGRARLASGETGAWLLAPTDHAIDTLVRARERVDLRALRIAITTPNQFSRMMRNSARAAIAHEAQDTLPDRLPHMSARHAADAAAGFAVLIGIGLCAAALMIAPHLVATVVGSLFLAAMVFRLLVCANGLAPTNDRDIALPDALLPFYTVLVPLHREAGMVKELVTSLAAIDYPRTKLEVLFLLEPRDRDTEAALQSCSLPTGFRIVIAPRGTIATKPRALNVGLMLATGSLITVFDAEDRPEPDQLRKAAARFATQPANVACLQARLAISNARDGVLQRLFALEYAALFDVYNIGLARWRLPIALGGTSNHFRAETLRAAGGWDAWNVTEDADLGLRLARLGYTTQCLDSTTWETALGTAAGWMKQRRRWTKGLMQTLIVLARDPSAARAFGPYRAAFVALTLTNLVTGPLLTPLAAAALIGDLCRKGFPAPHGIVDLAETTLVTSVVLLGIASTLWCGFIGARRRSVRWGYVSLPLLLPYQFLVSVAAWIGLLDLMRDPYHWHKTDHGPATLSPRAAVKFSPTREPAPNAMAFAAGRPRSGQRPL